MERYNKYLVLKISDIEKYLSDDKQLKLDALATCIRRGRLNDGKQDQQYVCIAADWPMYEQVWSMVEAFVDGKPNEIEQLTARVRELECELESAYKAVDDNWVSHQQLVASQAYAEQLREALNQWINIAANCSIQSGCCCCGDSMENHSSPIACGHSPVDMADSVVHSAIQKTDNALALPRDTSALDAYVAEKVKEV